LYKYIRLLDNKNQTKNMATSKGTSTVAAAAATTEKRSTVKLDTIREIEKQMQQIWTDLKVFEVDAPSQPTDK
jgi:leucyl-tRNA synthetase